MFQYGNKSMHFLFGKFIGKKEKANAVVKPATGRLLESVVCEVLCGWDFWVEFVLYLQLLFGLVPV